MARCANCGLELLGSMKKCPKCGYDMSTGQIDNNYLKNIDKSRGEAGVSKNNDKTLYCDGRFSDNRNAGDRCEIRIVNDEVLKVCNFKRNGFGRTVTKRAFGLVGTLIYDSVHEDDCVFEVKLDDIESVTKSNNPGFSDGWTIKTTDNRCVDIKVNQPVLGYLEKALGARMNISDCTISKPSSALPENKYCSSCGRVIPGESKFCPYCGCKN